MNFAPNICGIILDVDGTLVDSNEAHAKAFQVALQDYNVDFDLSEIRPLIGMGGKILVTKLLELPENAYLVERVIHRHDRIFEEEFLPKLTAYPGVRELVRNLKEELELNIVVGSSSAKSHLQRLLGIAEVKDLVDIVINSNNVKQAKPYPDIVEASLDALALNPWQAMMLGGTPHDIAAAGSAGVSTIALRCGGWGEEGLQDAIAIYDDPMDLLAHLEESPICAFRPVYAIESHARRSGD